MNNHVTKQPYRADIDGLRALAILAVIFYHTFPSFFPNGFLGVDIFFVISGFLITSNIVKALNQNDFSVLNFYFGRIKRLLPVALVVLVTSTVLANLVLFDNEYARYLKELRAALGYYANFQLAWNGSNYFDVSEMFKPLMHFWSLAVEEQFYLVWPLLLSILFLLPAKFKKAKPLLMSFGFIALISLYLFFDSSESYFLPIARAWQLLLGAIVSISFNDIRLNEKKSLVVVGASYLLLVLGFLSEIKFFGSVLVTLGAALFISTSINQLKRPFTNKLAVGIGLISYSLYLWHWPMLSFLRISYYPDIKASTYYLVLVTVLALSCVTYFFIEKPLKEVNWKLDFKSPTPVLKQVSKPITVLATSGILFLLAPYIPLIPFEGKVNYSAYKIAPLGPIHDFCQVAGKSVNYEQMDWCNLASISNSKLRQGIAIGDSHSRALYQGLKAAFPDISWQIMSHHSCNPFGVFSENSKACQRLFLSYLQGQADKPTVNFIVLSLANRVYSAENLSAESTMKLVSLLSKISQKGVKILIVDPIPEIAANMGACIRKRISLIQQYVDTTEQCSIVANEWNLKSKAQKDFYKKIKQAVSQVEIIDPEKTICQEGRCWAVLGQEPLYIDKDHLSAIGAERILRQYSESIKNLDM